MTRAEKATLLSGNGWWQTHAIERVGLPAMVVSDGPHGLRKVTGMAIAGSLPATCFPTASALAATWNVGLLGEVGAALGKEAQACGVQVLLGPGINIKRSPLGGRNFEYFSEDPLLTGELAASFVRGVQSEGVGTCVKHFAANNQELERMATSSDVDERTLREIYLAAFERVVTRAAPWTLMTAYNPVNGTYATEHPWLLRDVLRDEWGFSGCVISDWGAIDDRVAAVLAGTNLEMPGTGEYGRAKILAALEDGTLPEEALDRSLTELVAVVFRAADARKSEARFDEGAHHALARRAAGEAIVLLKNEDALLPVASHAKVALLGAFARVPRYQGAGSSQVNALRLDNAYEELVAQLGAENVTYTPCYDAEGAVTEASLDEAMALARRADVAVVFAGLPESYESEGFDRAHMDLPLGHQRLIEAVAAAQPNVAVVLVNGAAVTMPWASGVRAIVEAWLGGQAGGGAIADVLTGRTNPSGKLAETFPTGIEQTPAFPSFPGSHGHARYGEGVFVGYRHYDIRRVEPLFPFGFGLSYTEFRYLTIHTESTTFDPNREDALSVTVTIKNIGSRAGREVVQLYVRENRPTLPRPARELRAFAKVGLEPGEQTTVRLTLGWRDFAFFDPALRAWCVNTGVFQLLAGGSSRDLPLVASIEVTSARGPSRILTRLSQLKHFRDHPRGHSVYLDIVARLGFAHALDPDRPRAEGLSPEQIAAERKGEASVLAMIDDLPIGKVPAFTTGAFTDADVERAIAAAMRDASTP